MKNNIVIWLIGSNSTGKTTQAKLLHQFFKNGELVVHKGFEAGIEFKYTTFGSAIANVGVISDNQCCGVDTISKKKSIRLSYLKALEESTIVIVDGIMATGSWIDFIREREVILLVCHLEIDLSNNIMRVVQRRAIKRGIDTTKVEVNEKTVLNLSGKIKGFASLYNRVSPLAEIRLQVDAMVGKNEIHMKILKSLKNYL